MASNESKIPVGTILVGKYRVVREIGRGGMAAVYEAEQLSLGKKVAVKILAAELAASTIVIERFFREARAAASVRSPYIVDVYDSGRLDDGRPFITMELLEGESLYDRMARVRIIDVETTIRVVVHTARGLVKAHAAGIVHRDLKPENIFLTKGEDGDDLCKILDFGLAKFYAPVNPEEKAQKRLTREGAVFGTPAYMSPEQVKGQGNVDHRADLWALGCMAYECLIGRPVWNMDQGVAMTFASIATGPIPVPSQARADLPPSFDAWFKKCLERDPGRRYQSAKELSDAFVESWGQRPHSSNSFPNVMPHGAIPGSGAHAPANPFVMGGELQSVPSAAQSTRRGVGGEPIVNGGNGANMRESPQHRGSVASDASVPLPLVTRTSTDAVGAPRTSQPDAPHAPKKVSPVRMAISGVLFAGAMTTAIFVWIRFLSPQVFSPVVQSTATATPSGDPSANPPLGPAPEEPKWAPMIADGQKLFTAGNYADARTKFEQVIGMGGQAARVGQVYVDQTRVAEKAAGTCKPASFSRPRIADQKRAERPAIAATSKGAVIAWIDDHEQEKRDHVYATMLDNTGKTIGNPRDLTPEATAANRPQIAAAGSDRLVLLYWDEKGKEAGVRARLLDADGRIDKNKGASVLVGAARAGQFWPAIDKGPQGFYVVWQDDKDKENDFDLFARRVPFDLEMAGTKETRLTDYNATAKSKAAPPRVRYPAVAVVANTLVIAYRLEKEKEKEKIVVRMRVPLGDFDKGGLDESKDPNRTSRELGDVSLVSEEKSGADAPAVACGPEGCFIVWHGDNGGAWAAMIDPQEGRVIWRKKFSDKGGRPSLGVNEGSVAVAYFEKGLVKMALLSGDGVGTSSALFRVFDEKNVPRPYLSPGVQRNEWQLAWQDSDVPRGLGEVYAARVVCR